MKIYTVKSITWIEDHYEEDNYYEDSFFLNRESAENCLNEIVKSEESEDDDYGYIYKVIKARKEGIQYLVLYNDEYNYYEDVCESNTIEYLWQNGDACWYYIKELEVR